MLQPALELNKQVKALEYNPHISKRQKVKPW